jgi:hypothetical protein
VSQNRDLIRSLYEACACGDTTTVLGPWPPTSVVTGRGPQEPTVNRATARSALARKSSAVYPHQFRVDEDTVVALSASPTR